MRVWISRGRGACGRGRVWISRGRARLVCSLPLGCLALACGLGLWSGPVVWACGLGLWSGPVAWACGLGLWSGPLVLACGLGLGAWAWGLDSLAHTGHGTNQVHALPISPRSPGVRSATIPAHRRPTAGPSCLTPTDAPRPSGGVLCARSGFLVV